VGALGYGGTPASGFRTNISRSRFEQLWGVTDAFVANVDARVLFIGVECTGK
jgi:hypothetical protein